MTEPLVTVVIPTYNRADYIAETIESVLAQTYQNLEIIVIDDGSTDETEQVVARFVPPVRYVKQKNSERGASRNHGLRLARGEYVSFLDSDDVWLPNLLERRESALAARANAVLAYGHAFLIDADDNIYVHSADWRNFEFPDGDATPMLYIGTAPVSSTVVYRRESLEKYGWNEDSKLEDYELYLLLSDSGEFAFDAHTDAAWRKHGANTSRDLDFMLRECLNAQRSAGERLGWSDEKLAAIARNTRFFYGEEFDRAGDKRRARELIYGNLGGAWSATVLARGMIRSLVPDSLMNLRSGRNAAKNIERYGKVEIG